MIATRGNAWQIGQTRKISEKMYGNACGNACS